MFHARTGRHPLQLSRPNDRSVPEAVPVLKLTFEEWWMEYERNATEIINRTAEEGK